MDEITVQLSHAEALVLFEWLASLEDNPNPPAQDDAEQRVLWGVECQLEKLLPDVFSEKYRERVVASKAKILDADA